MLMFERAGVPDLPITDPCHPRNPRFRKSVGPLAVRRAENRQFFHHELRFADRTDHTGAGGGVPFLRHALTGVTAPTFDIRVSRKHPAIYLPQLVLVKP